MSKMSGLIRIVGGASAIMLGVAALGLTVAQAAASHPTVTFSLANAKLSVGVRPKLNYHVTGAPKSSKLAIQINAGGGWKTDATLSLPDHSSGSWSGPAASRGRFRYRLRVEQGSNTLTTSPALTLLVYGTIPLSALLGTQVAAVTISGQSYRYAWTATDWDSDSITQIAPTSCRSLHLTMAYTQNSATNIADVATLLVIQQAKTVTSNVTSGAIGTVNANLTGGFEVALENAPGTAYGNGTASCWSSDGRA